MWRTFFLSVGIALAIFGAEFLVVEKAIWAKEADQSDVQQVAEYLAKDGAPAAEPQKTNEAFQPQPWVPWAMLSSGTIVILYCLSIPKQN